MNIDINVQHIEINPWTVTANDLVGLPLGYEVPCSTGVETVPAWAVVTRHTTCSWVPGINQATVRVAEVEDETGLTVWAWSTMTMVGGPFEGHAVHAVLYCGPSREAARQWAEQSEQDHIYNVVAAEHVPGGPAPTTVRTTSLRRG